MKQLLMSSAVSLITGFCFVGGAFLAAFIFDENDYFEESPTYIDEPQGFEFLNHQTIKLQGNYAVKGIIKNTSGRTWDNVQINLGLYAGELYINYCSSGFDYLGPNSERPFTVICNDISGYNIPENITYKLTVRRAKIKD